MASDLPSGHSWHRRSPHWARVLPLPPCRQPPSQLSLHAKPLHLWSAPRLALHLVSHSLPPNARTGVDGQDRAHAAGGHRAAEKGVELCAEMAPGGREALGRTPPALPHHVPPPRQCTAPPATTTTPPPTAASAAPWAPTSLSSVRTTASPARATPAPTRTAPPTSRTAKVGAALPTARALG